MIAFKNLYYPHRKHVQQSFMKFSALKNADMSTLIAFGVLYIFVLFTNKFGKC